MFILIVRNDRLGDLILALPAVQALRRRHPEARIGLVVAQATAPLLELYPERVERWIDDEEHLRRLSGDRPDAIVFLYPDRRWARAASRARVPERIGTAYRRWSWRFNRRVRVHRRSSGRHEAELNLAVAAPLSGEAACVLPGLQVPSPYARRADDLLARVAGLGPDEPFVAIHPGSSGSAWNWPPDRYAETVAALAAEDIPVVVTGASHEQELALLVAGPAGRVIAGQTDLPLLGAVLARSRVTVAGSTGPLHLAAALGRPVVALFSPHPSHSPVRWGPLGSGHRILVPNVEDESDFGAHAADAVMRNIRATDVTAAVHSAWERAGVAS
jgi:ADP-heptose:LPS heptosyltransferase